MFTNQSFRYKVIEYAQKEYKSPESLSEKKEKYLRIIGLGSNHNYCVAFVYWCYEQAAKFFGITNPMLKTGKTGTLYTFAETHNLFVEQPEIGDIYIKYNKEHTGLIQFSNPNYKTKKTKTIEGNTYVLRDLDGDGERDDRLWGLHERNKDLSEAYFIRL
ncbi:MAG TPA: hypothetical protein VNB22_14000 [Pyrinomonadaceae bacterium]|jgi:hypothetical protein|nr:hypothetical protein [Pyrinomonadaceae bacterium]